MLLHVCCVGCLHTECVNEATAATTSLLSYRKSGALDDAGLFFCCMSRFFSHNLEQLQQCTERNNTDFFFYLMLVVCANLARGV